MAKIMASLLGALGLLTAYSGEVHAQAPVCNLQMTANQCAEAQLKAAGEILGKYKAEIARLEAEINALKSAPKAQVGMLPCYKRFSTAGAIAGGTQLQVDFDLAADCQGAKPIDGWTYTATLFGTTICGGFAEYTLSADPKKPSIKFFGAKPFCAASDSEVWVHYIGFSPRAF
jgi:hypothetical protein